MGSKLAGIAAQLILVTVAAAQPAPDQVKKGVEAYKAGRYDDAAALFSAAYDSDPKPDTLFALAQAERLGGHCDKAVPHYKKLFETTTDLAAAKAVQNNLALCPEAVPPEPKPDVKPDVKPDIKPDVKPEPTTAPPPRTIVRDVSHTDGLGVALVGAGALGAGLGAGFLLRSSDARDQASTARTLDDANHLQDVADRDRTIGFVAAGVGVAALAYGIFRIATTHDSSETPSAVAVVPLHGGSILTLSRAF